MKGINKMKSKELIKFLQKFDENAELNIFLVKTGKRIKLEHSDVEVLDTNRIDINVQAQLNKGLNKNMKNTYFEKCNQIIDEIIKLRNKSSIKELSNSEKAKINEVLETILKD